MCAEINQAPVDHGTVLYQTSTRTSDLGTAAHRIGLGRFGFRARSHFTAPPMPRTRSDDTVTATEAARILGVSRMTLWRLTRSGEIKPVESTAGGEVRAGRARYRRADLEALVDGRDVEDRAA